MREEETKKIMAHPFQARNVPRAAAIPVILLTNERFSTLVQRMHSENVEST